MSTTQGTNGLSASKSTKGSTAIAVVCCVAAVLAAPVVRADDVGWATSQTATGQERTRERAEPRSPSFELSGSLLWLGTSTLGSSAATMTPDQGQTRYTYFNTSASLQSVAGVDARLTYHVTSMFAVEGGFTYSHPGVALTVSGDAENTPGFTSTGERLSQYFLDAAALVDLRPLTFAEGRGRPFVEGGVGYLRQLHEGNVVAGTGQVYHTGGGVKYFVIARPRGFFKSFGFRFDARIYFRSGGYSFNNTSRAFPAIGAGAVVAF